MKRWTIFLMVALAGFVMAEEKLTEEELEDLQDAVNIVSVNDDTIDIEDAMGEDVEWIQLKFSINQRADWKKDYKFRVRVTIELEDKKTSTIVYSQFARLRGEFTDGENYLGVDEWQYIVPQGELKRPKVSAYVIQYGVMVGDEYVVLAEEFDDVDTLEELLERTPERLEKLSGREELKPKLEYRYHFQPDDEDAQVTEWM